MTTEEMNLKRPITDEREENEDTIPGLDTAKLPQKRLYRQRAHCNPWSDHMLEFPVRPDQQAWSSLYGDEGPAADSPVTMVDVGCGYGGLLFHLSNTFPLARALGMEIRLKVVDYVQSKVRALRQNHPGRYQNVACIRTNAMKYLPNYFEKGQLEKMFFLFPDPHFKRQKHKWRIISLSLLTIYAYLLRPGVGRVYTMTDVPDLASWMVGKLRAHPLFREVAHLQLPHATASRDAEGVAEAGLEDPTVALLAGGCTEEGEKAAREGRGATLTVFERIPDPSW